MLNLTINYMKSVNTVSIVLLNLYNSITYMLFMALLEVATYVHSFGLLCNYYSCTCQAGVLTSKYVKCVKTHALALQCMSVVHDACTLFDVTNNVWKCPDYNCDNSTAKISHSIWLPAALVFVCGLRK